MRRDLHLDISEIAAFGTGSRSEQCDETLRHLLKCRDCRNLLPLPTTKELWRSILEDRSKPKAEDTNESLFLGFAFIARLFGRIGSLPLLTRATAVAAVLFLAIAGFSMLLMFGRVAKTDDRTMAQVRDTYIEPVDSGETPLRTDSENASSPEMRTESRVEVAKPSHSRSSKRQADPNHSAGRKNRGLPGDPAIKFSKRSETRGSGTACGENSTVGLEIHALGSGMRLKWEKLAGAISYAVYLSDLDARLIDQFETESETSYLTTSRIEPETTYRWKLVVSMKGGRTILVTSRNFRPADFDGRRIPLRRRTIASVRCTEDK